MKMNRILGGLLTLVLAIGVIAPAGFVSAAVHADGTNVISNGTIYMIVNGQRRAYTSAGAFLSYGFNSWGTVVQASAEDLVLSEGNFIPPRDGKIVCSDRSPDKGTCYLITNGKRAAFVSAAVFQQLGFKFSAALYGDVSFLAKDADISNSSDAHRAGVLINRYGTIYLISTGGLIGIPNPEILNSWGYSFSDAVAANGKDYDLQGSRVMVARKGGQLSPADNTSVQITDEDRAIVMRYISNYPDLPNDEVDSPDDEDAIEELLNASGESLSENYKYLSKNSIALLTEAPNIAAMFDEEVQSLPYMEVTDTEMEILAGKQYAKARVEEKQDYSDYEQTFEFVFVKEDGEWKYDFIGMVKLIFDYNARVNPNDDWVKGSGTTDVTAEGILFENKEVKINDDNERAIIGITNNGKTTVYNYLVQLVIDGRIAFSRVVSYKLRSGEGILVALPLKDFWHAGILNTSGQYKVELSVDFYEDTETLDKDPSDNYTSIDWEFVN